MPLTLLERAILRRYADAYSAWSFPHVEDIRAERREKTGFGLFVHLTGSTPSTLPDWLCHLPDGHALRILTGAGAIELAVNLFILDGFPRTLELFRPDNKPWNGRIGAWTLKDVLLVA